MSKIHNILKTYWGYPNFRPLQEEIIQAVLAGRDTLALLPTGGGKSICFQVPALALEGLCVVISPLIALMQDQVEQLKRRGIKALAVHSNMGKREIDIALDNCAYGNVSFLYISPERLQTDLFLQRASKMPIKLLAVDEAHCISQWGYDFRPPYLQIAEFRETIPKVPCIALTASATAAVKADIIARLQFKEYRVFQKTFARDNLSYSAFSEEHKFSRVTEILRNVPGTSIIYVRSRKRTQEVARMLQKLGISADFYHAGLAAKQRESKQSQWIAGKTRVMVATNAFGMGIDKPDVRTVIHLDLPDSLEAYYQEAGRAGRDGQKAYAVVLYNQADVSKLLTNTEAANPSPDTIRKVYKHLCNHFKLAVGSGMMVTFPFRIEDFVQTFGLKAQAVFFSLKKLEEQGLIELGEAFSNPSKIMLLADKQELYEFQVTNGQYDHTLKTILRMYGGELFNNYLPIAERALSKALNITGQQLAKRLSALKSFGILDYVPQSEHPTITFLHERQIPERLPIDTKLLRELKERYLLKAKAVVGFVENERLCRTLQILRYFDERTDAPCGICDHCLKQKREQRVPQAKAKLREWVKGQLKQAPKSYQELAAGKPQHEQIWLSEVLRELLEWGEVCLRADKYELE